MFRPKCPVIAVVANRASAKQLHLHRGVFPVVVDGEKYWLVLIVFILEVFIQDILVLDAFVKDLFVLDIFIAELFVWDVFEWYIFLLVESLLMIFKLEILLVLCTYWRRIFTALLAENFSTLTVAFCAAW